MSENTSIEAQTAAKVAERRNKGGRPPKAHPKPEQDATDSGIEAQTAVLASEVFPSVAVEASPEPKPASKTKRLFPVTMLRNYHPLYPFLINGVEPNGEQRVKVPAGASIEMDVDEAREIIGKGIAARNDPIG